MKKGRPLTIGSPRVSIRVVLSEADYEFLKQSGNDPSPGIEQHAIDRFTTPDILIP